ncbi:MAG: hypothetical protein AAFP13_15945 [Pseudomonadota bacterium]
MTRLEDLSPAALLDAAIRVNRPWTVLRALIAAQRRRARRLRSLPAHRLPDHLRRDVGLPAREPPTRPPDYPR